VKLIHHIKKLFGCSTPAVLGVSFQPYVGPWVGGQPVLFNTYTLAQVTALLKPVSKKFKAISTYGQGTFVWQGVPRIQDSNQYCVQAAKANGLKISAGCALQGINPGGDSFNIEWSKCDVDFALAQAKQYGNVVDIVIGNESIFGPNSATQLVSLMQYAKTARKKLGLKTPITTRQRWDVMAGVNNTTPGYATTRAALLSLAAECDGYIYVDMYPYFDPGIAAAIGGQSASQAVFTTAIGNSMNATWGALKAAWSAQGLTLGLRLGETGWPTSGAQSGQPAAWLANPRFAQWYLYGITRWMTLNRAPGYIFEAYDEPWKGPADGSSSESSFGVWTAVGTSSAVNQYTLTGETQKYPV
jgi:exo-beta-1,3-glucanase (GH17 family)